MIRLTRRHPAAWWLAALGAPLALALLAAPPAAAQDVNPSHFEPSLSPVPVLGVDGSLPTPHLRAWGALSLSLANDELVTFTRDGSDVGPLRSRVITTLVAGLGLFERFDVAVGMPLHAVEAYEEDGRATRVAAGDLRLALRGRLLGPARGTGGVGLALAVDLGFPTGGSAPFSTDGGISASPRLILDLRTARGLVIALNLGARLRPTTTVVDLAVGHELRAGLGVEAPLGFHGLAILGEVLAAAGIAQSDADPEGISARRFPVELLGGVRWRSREGGVMLSAAAGAGLTDGYGAPDYRAVLSVAVGDATWVEPPPPEPQPDPPLFVAHSDPEATLAAIAGAPRAARPERSDAAPAPPDRLPLDELLAADLDADGDGIPLPIDQCPDEPEDFNGFQDEDGCPDGGPPIADAAPPPVQPPGVTRDGDVIAVEGQVTFVSGSASLTDADRRVLDRVVAFLRAHPDIPRVQVEGHTDNLGDQEFNVDLAERRAWAVRAYLIEEGVDPGRLIARGFGATRPVASNATAEGRARNRRVVFQVVPIGTEALDTPPTTTPRGSGERR